MKTANFLLSQTGTTIFTLMSALAVQHDAINLGQGFPDTEGPADIVQAAADALLDNRNQYPPMTGTPELRQAVADANKRFYGLNINPQTGVLVTSGATEAITACLMALINPGDEIVLFEPLYDTYLPVVRLLGGVAKLVRLTPPQWALPFDDLAAAFSPRTKLILLNSPMNPCGKVFNEIELSYIADLLEQYDSYAVCDEVYEHLVFPPAVHIPLMTLAGMAERTLRIGSAGKTFSLTGWKVGYVSGPAALIELAAKAHQNLTFTTAPNLQRAVALGLNKSDDYFSAAWRPGWLPNATCWRPALKTSALTFCRRMAAIFSPPISRASGSTASILNSAGPSPSMPASPPSRFRLSTPATRRSTMSASPFASGKPYCRKHSPALRAIWPPKR